MKYLLIILAVLISNGAFAADYKASPISSVKFVSSYNEFGNGDVQIRLDENGSDCTNGFWMTKSDPGFEANFSMVLAAAQASSKIRIYGLPNKLWPGSSNIYCKVYSVEFHK